MLAYVWPFLLRSFFHVLFGYVFAGVISYVIDCVECVLLSAILCWADFAYGYSDDARVTCASDMLV